jgi:hypothetical protein
LSEDDRECESFAETTAGAEILFGRACERALDALPDFTRLHAASVTLGGRRVAIAGAAGSGKTTLATRLLFEHCAPHGDDLLLIAGGQAISFPRRFRLRPESLRWLPQIADAAPSLPRDRDCLALDPSDLGFRWEISTAPADVVIFLQSRGSAVRIAPSPRHAMAQKLMGQSNMPAAGPRQWVSDVCALVDGARCYVLDSGSLDATALAIKNILE